MEDFENASEYAVSAGRRVPSSVRVIIYLTDGTL
jgi:hypothetical protein